MTSHFEKIFQNVFFLSRPTNLRLLCTNIQKHAGHEQALPQRPLRDSQAGMDPMSRLPPIFPEPTGPDSSHTSKAPDQKCRDEDRLPKCR